LAICPSRNWPTNSAEEAIIIGERLRNHIPTVGSWGMRFAPAAAIVVVDQGGGD